MMLHGSCVAAIAWMARLRGVHESRVNPTVEVLLQQLGLDVGHKPKQWKRVRCHPFCCAACSLWIDVSFHTISGPDVGSEQMSVAHHQIMKGIEDVANQRAA
eukprot:scaffold129437_cov18-Tisochrysis_lutea.AAC.2